MSGPLFSRVGPFVVLVEKDEHEGLGWLPSGHSDVTESSISLIFMCHDMNESVGPGLNFKKTAS